MGRGTRNKTKAVSTDAVENFRRKKPAPHTKPLPKKQELSNYEQFMKEKLRVHYIAVKEDVLAARKHLREIAPTKIGLDFETSSKNGNFGLANGSIRLMQIGVDEPGIAPEQFVIDCHRVPPDKLYTLLSSKKVEKQILNLDFEQKWSVVHLGVQINNIYDPMHAWREIQKKLKTMTPEEIDSVLPGYIYEPHGNGLAALCKKGLNIDLPKDEQSSDWSNNSLTLAQAVYAANDAAVMLPLTEWTKEIAKKLDIEEEVAARIDKASKRAIEQAVTYMANNPDDSNQLVSALRRAQNLEVLENIHRSGQVLPIYASNRIKVRNTYEKRKIELSKKR